jgi:hypothetical protein
MGVNRLFKGFRARQEAQRLADLKAEVASSDPQDRTEL